VQRPGSHIDPDALAQAAPELAAEVAQRWCTLDQLRTRPCGGLAVLALQELRPESSTELRHRIAAGTDWRGWLPPSVASYIDRHRLYSTAEPDSVSL
jgi:nicotinate-nucleotide adenylyltransferase